MTMNSETMDNGNDYITTGFGGAECRVIENYDRLAMVDLHARGLNDIVRDHVARLIRHFGNSGRKQFARDRMISFLPDTSSYGSHGLMTEFFYEEISLEMWGGKIKSSDDPRISKALAKFHDKIRLEQEILIPGYRVPGLPEFNSNEDFSPDGLYRFAPSTPLPCARICKGGRLEIYPKKSVRFESLKNDEDTVRAYETVSILLEPDSISISRLLYNSAMETRKTPERAIKSLFPGSDEGEEETDLDVIFNSSLRKEIGILRNKRDRLKEINTIMSGFKVPELSEQAAWSIMSGRDVSGKIRSAISDLRRSAFIPECEIDREMITRTVHEATMRVAGSVERAVAANRYHSETNIRKGMLTAIDQLKDRVEGFDHIEDPNERTRAVIDALFHHMIYSGKSHPDFVRELIVHYTGTLELRLDEPGLTLSEMRKRYPHRIKSVNGSNVEFILENNRRKHRALSLRIAYQLMIENFSSRKRMETLLARMVVARAVEIAKKSQGTLSLDDARIVLMGMVLSTSYNWFHDRIISKASFTKSGMPHHSLISEARHAALVYKCIDQLTHMDAVDSTLWRYMRSMTRTILTNRSNFENNIMRRGSIDIVPTGYRYSMNMTNGNPGEFRMDSIKLHTYRHADGHRTAIDPSMDVFFVTIDLPFRKRPFPPPKRGKGEKALKFREIEQPNGKKKWIPAIPCYDTLGHHLLGFPKNEIYHFDNDQSPEFYIEEINSLFNEHVLHELGDSGDYEPLKLPRGERMAEIVALSATMFNKDRKFSPHIHIVIYGNRDRIVREFENIRARIVRESGDAIGKSVFDHIAEAFDDLMSLKRFMGRFEWVWSKMKEEIECCAGHFVDFEIGRDSFHNRQFDIRPIAPDTIRIHDMDRLIDFMYRDDTAIHTDDLLHYVNNAVNALEREGIISVLSEVDRTIGYMHSPYRQGQIKNVIIRHPKMTQMKRSVPNYHDNIEHFVRNATGWNTPMDRDSMKRAVKKMDPYSRKVLANYILMPSVVTESRLSARRFLTLIPGRRRRTEVFNAAVGIALECSVSMNRLRQFFGSGGSIGRMTAEFHYHVALIRKEAESAFMRSLSTYESFRNNLANAVVGAGRILWGEIWGDDHETMEISVLIARAVVSLANVIHISDIRSGDLEESHFDFIAHRVNGSDLHPTPSGGFVNPHSRFGGIVSSIRTRSIALACSLARSPSDFTRMRDKSVDRPRIAYKLLSLFDPPENPLYA